MTIKHGLTFTEHARDRMIEFNVSYDEVVQIIEHPEVAYLSKTDPLKKQYALISQAGKWAVVTSTNKSVVITVLPRVIEQWEHSEEQ